MLTDRRGGTTLGVGLLLTLLVTACSQSGTVAGGPASAVPGPGSPAPASASPRSGPSAAADPSGRTPASRYEREILRDEPRAYWPLRTEPGPDGRTRAVELVGGLDAVSSGGPVGSAPGPSLSGEVSPAVTFRGLGRLITPLTGASAPAGYTIEMWVRIDACTREWGRIAGERGRGPRVRDGMEVFHYPVQGDNPCSIGVEYWLEGRYLGGCSLPEAPVPGQWLHFAYTVERSALTCYRDGRQVDSARLGTFPSTADVPFGIGGDASGAAGALAAGTLAHVAVYDRPLSGSTLLTHATSRN